MWTVWVGEVRNLQARDLARRPPQVVLPGNHVPELLATGFRRRGRDVGVRDNQEPQHVAENVVRDAQLPHVHGIRHNIHDDQRGKEEQRV